MVRKLRQHGCAVHDQSVHERQTTQRVSRKSVSVNAADGSLDEVVPQQLGLAARDALRADGYALEWHSYPMPHAVCIEEIQAVGAWLTARLAD